MKARPVKLIYAKGYFDCPVEEATHVELRMPGPIPTRYIPVILKGQRFGTDCWTWNGSVDAPTLRPSILSETHEHRCHTWVENGQAVFLPDSTHELAGQTVDLLDIKQGESDVAEI